MADLSDTDRRMLLEAVDHYQAGRLADAEALLGQVLESEPDDFDSVHLLGLVRHARGDHAQAIEILNRAAGLLPTNADVWVNLAEAHRAAGRPADAEPALRRGLSLDPDHLMGHNNLSVVLHKLGRNDEALALVQWTLRRAPNFDQAWNNLGMIRLALGDAEGAVEACRRALSLRPDMPEALVNLGMTFQAVRNLDAAQEAFERAVAVQPGRRDALHNLGSVLRDKGLLDDAEAVCRRAIAGDPGDATAWCSLGGVLKDKGLHDEGLAAFRRACELAPESIHLPSGVLFTMLTHPGVELEEIATAHRQWGRRMIQSVPAPAPHTNDRNPDRRLRIGYVSPDFRTHVVARNLLPLMQNHDKEQVEIFCYADLIRPDQRTSQFQACADHWRNVTGKSADEVARIVRDDCIDILVDLALHTQGNRLPVFARKPAPVQFTFAGYPGTTGLPTIDYRITDSILDPPGQNDDLYVERSLRLETCWWCYHPDAEEPMPGPLPALAAGHVTFGCLNKFGKVTPDAVRAWRRILSAVPRSRLMVMCGQGSHRDAFRAAVAEVGVQADRIEFHDRMAVSRYLALYRQIDIALDTYPYNGHTTSLDALWMGVPVVSWAGRPVVSRAGLSQLSRLGLQHLVADSADGYVDKAVALASDLTGLAEIRAGLRQRMRTSVLMDGQAFARGIEKLYRQAWREWCRRPATPP